MSFHIRFIKYRNKDYNSFSKIVLMPGDPLRAQWIAKEFFKRPKLVNNVRGMTAYVGYYKGKKVSVMPSGMGIPSIGIYSHELLKDFGVEGIIRVGTCGSYKEHIKVGSMFLATSSFSESTYGKVLNDYKESTFNASKELIDTFRNKVKELKHEYHEGTIHSSDAFYNNKTSQYIKDKSMLTVEMESFGLYANAKLLNKKALTICTVSDSLITNESMNHDQKEKGLHKMIEVALSIAIEYENN